MLARDVPADEDRPNSSDNWIQVVTSSDINHGTSTIEDGLPAVKPVDVFREIYPFCLVWTPIHPLTMLLPFVGHLGIANSRGVVYDFIGPYMIGQRVLAFGGTSRYLQLCPERIPGGAEAWDAAIDAANSVYCQKVHNLW
jgi:hypothetical protein